MAFEQTIISKIWIELTDNLWNSSGRFSQDSLQWESSTRFNRRWENYSVNQRTSQAGSFFMSMFNDIVWDAEGKDELQGVAVNWIFSSRIKFVGLEVILGVMTVVGGSGLFLSFWRSLGGPLGEQDVLKNTFLNLVKNLSHCQTTPYPIHWNEKIDIACLRKVLKTHSFLTLFLFHRIGYFGTTGSVELNMSKNAMFNSMGRPIFPIKKKAHLFRSSMKVATSGHEWGGHWMRLSSSQVVWSVNCVLDDAHLTLRSRVWRHWFRSSTPRTTGFQHGSTNPCQIAFHITPSQLESSNNHKMCVWICVMVMWLWLWLWLWLWRWLWLWMCVCCYCACGGCCCCRSHDQCCDCLVLCFVAVVSPLWCAQCGCFALEHNDFVAFLQWPPWKSRPVQFLRFQIITRNSKIITRNYHMSPKKPQLDIGKYPIHCNTPYVKPNQRQWISSMLVDSFGGLDLKRCGTELAIPNQMDLGTELQRKSCWLSQKPIIRYSLVPVREEI